MKVIAISNIKGGSGKSTLASHLSLALSSRGKTIGIDLDLQGDFTDFCLPAVDPQTIEEKNVLELLLGRKKLSEVLFAAKGFDIVPATLGLAHLRDLAPDRFTLSASFFSALEEASRVYKYMVLDTPGSSKWELLLALEKADLVLVPVTPSKWTIRAVNLLLDEISKTERPLDGARKVAFVPTWFGNSVKHRDLLEKLRQIEEFQTLSEIPKLEGIKTKTEKHEPLKKNTNAWYAFDRLADEVESLFEPKRMTDFFVT